MIKDDDWRIRDQELYIRKKAFYKHSFLERYVNDDHAHCEFCWAKFDRSENSQKGLSTLDDEFWVCEECFADFQEKYEMQIWDPGNYKENSIENILEREIGSCRGHKNIFQADRIIRTLQKLMQLDLLPINGIITPVIVCDLYKKDGKPQIETIERLSIELHNGNIMDFQESITELKNRINDELITDVQQQKAYIELRI